MISQVKVWPLKKTHPKIKANASFVVDGFRIKCTVFNGPKGLYVSLPGKYGEKVDEKTGKKPWFSDVDCTDEKIRKELNDTIINAFKKATGGATAQGEAPDATNQEGPDEPPFG